VIRQLVARGLAAFTRTPDARAAWRTLVTSRDVVGIKVHSAPGSVSGTRPAVVTGLVETLLAAGHPARQIIIWDRDEADLRRAGFVELARRLGVRAAGAHEAGYDEKNFYESPFLGQLIWGDFEFHKHLVGAGRKSFVTKLLANEITKVVTVSPLLNHNRAGVWGCVAGLALGSVDNTIRFESESGRLAEAVPEIYALPPVGDRVALNVVDAVFCQYLGEHLSLLHYSVPLGQIRFSTDPVALDVLSIEELDKQRQRHGMPAARKLLDLYHNAEMLQLGVSDRQNIRVEQR
jgi:uncharacterized Fe-S center protein